MPDTQTARRFDTAVAAAAWPLMALAAIAAAALVLAPPTDAQLAAADPVLAWGGAVTGRWAGVIAALLVGATWLSWRKPNAAALRETALWFVIGAAAAVGIVFGLRVGLGPTAPELLPLEETGAAGVSLGLTAAVMEEAVFRFVVFAPAYLVLRRWLPVIAAAPLAALAAGAVVVASKGGVWPPDAVSTTTLLVRGLGPGMALSLLFLRPGPGFALGLHASAAIALAVAYPAPD